MNHNAALVHKAWLETRARFVASLLLLAALTVWTVWRAPGVMASFAQFQRGQIMSYAEYLWISLYRGYLQAFWIASALILGLGGLWREQAHGTAAFSLSLPVSRRRHTFIRIAVALAEIVLLGLLPAVLIAVLSRVVHQHYPLSQALLYSLLLVMSGAIFFALGVLLSHLIQKEFAAPSIGIALAMMLFFLTKLPQLEVLNVFDLMSGADYMTGRTFMILGPLPWAPLMATVVSAGIILLAAAKLIEIRDF